MLARMPEDHWVSLDAGETEGRFQSKPWGPPARIFVNADVQGGSIQVELVTPNGEVIRDFARADCLPITASGRNQSRLAKRPPALGSEIRPPRGHIGSFLFAACQALFVHDDDLEPDGKLARDKANARWLEASSTARTTGAGKATSLPAASHRAASLESDTARPFRGREENGSCSAIRYQAATGHDSRSSGFQGRDEFCRVNGSRLSFVIFRLN